MSRVLPCLAEVTELVHLGVVVDAYLEDIGEFRPGEAWGDCAARIAAEEPALAEWLREAERRWDELDSHSSSPSLPGNAAT